MFFSIQVELDKDPLNGL